MYFKLFFFRVKGKFLVYFLFGEGNVLKHIFLKTRWSFKNVKKERFFAGDVYFSSTFQMKNPSIETVKPFHWETTDESSWGEFPFPVFVFRVGQKLWSEKILWLVSNKNNFTLWSVKKWWEVTHSKRMGGSCEGC